MRDCVCACVQARQFDVLFLTLFIGLTVDYQCACVFVCVHSPLDLVISHAFNRITGDYQIQVSDNIVLWNWIYLYWSVGLKWFKELRFLTERFSTLTCVVRIYTDILLGIRCRWCFTLCTESLQDSGVDVIVCTDGVIVALADEEGARTTSKHTNWAAFTLLYFQFELPPYGNMGGQQTYRYSHSYIPCLLFSVSV